MHFKNNCAHRKVPVTTSPIYVCMIASNSKLEQYLPTLSKDTTINKKLNSDKRNGIVAWNTTIIRFPWYEEGKTNGVFGSTSVQAVVGNNCTQGLIAGSGTAVAEQQQCLTVDIPLEYIQTKPVEGDKHCEHEANMHKHLCDVSIC